MQKADSQCKEAAWRSLSSSATKSRNDPRTLSTRAKGSAATQWAKPGAHQSAVSARGQTPPACTPQQSQREPEKNKEHLYLAWSPHLRQICFWEEFPERKRSPPGGSAWHRLRPSGKGAKHQERHREGGPSGRGVPCRLSGEQPPIQEERRLCLGSSAGWRVQLPACT